jgi:hypothetical protein
MGRIQGLTDTRTLTGSQLLKTGEGYVFSITLAWTGAIVGDKVYLRDGTDGTAAPLVVFVLPTANGTLTKEWANGKQFTVGLYYDEGTPANCFTELTYK